MQKVIVKIVVIVQYFWNWIRGRKNVAHLNRAQRRVYLKDRGQKVPGINKPYKKWDK